MRIGLWNDEDRLFVGKTFGLGATINLKYVAKRLGLIKRSSPTTPPAPPDEAPKPAGEESREDRLRRQIESSKAEEK